MNSFYTVEHPSPLMRVFKRGLMSVPVIATVLSLQCCVVQPASNVSATASPQLLVEKFHNDPENAWRYVNRGNANTVLRVDENYTILHAAAFQRNFPLVQALVENGANPGVKARWPYDSGGFSDYVRTPATEALMWGRQDIAGYLTEQSGEDLGKLVEEADRDARRGHAEAVRDGLKVMRQAVELDKSLR